MNTGDTLPEPFVDAEGMPTIVTGPGYTCDGAAVATYLRKRGVSDEYISRLTIQVGVNWSLIEGSFNNRLDDPRVNISRLGSLKNSILVHELRHAADLPTRGNPRLERRMTQAGNLGFIALAADYVTRAAIVGLDHVTRANVASSADARLGHIAMVLSAMTLPLYLLNPAEVRAFGDQIAYAWARMLGRGAIFITRTRGTRSQDE